MLSGTAIIPAVFSFGFEPTSGPGLMFHTLPAVFESMPFGKILGFIFFILVFFAALTSAMASLEVVSAALIDRFNFSRHKATISMAIIIAVISILVSLSNGLLSNIKIMGMILFDFLVYITDKIFMPIAAILTCIFVGYVLKTKNLVKEIEIGSNHFHYAKSLDIIMKYIAPIFISIVLVLGIIQI